MAFDVGSYSGYTGYMQKSEHGLANTIRLNGPGTQMVV
jgi:hypothetical protein